MVLGTSKKQTTQARRLIEKFRVKERLKIAPSKTLSYYPRINVILSDENLL